MDEFVDSFGYSDDGLYRWWYERRWSDGPGLCWIGLNPSTGDTTGRPRPTLRKVVARAKAAGLNAVTGRSPITLAAWGSNGVLMGRGRAVASLLDRPVCLGITASGELRHPLYVPSGAEFTPLRPFRIASVRITRRQ